MFFYYFFLLKSSLGVARILFVKIQGVIIRNKALEINVVPSSTFYKMRFIVPFWTFYLDITSNIRTISLLSQFSVLMSHTVLLRYKRTEL